MSSRLLARALSLTLSSMAPSIWVLEAGANPDWLTFWYHHGFERESNL